MKYLRLQQHRTCYLEAARTQVRLMKIRVKLQLNQYPGSILGTLETLRNRLRRHRYPGSLLGTPVIVRKVLHELLAELGRKRAR